MEKTLISLLLVLCLIAPGAAAAAGSLDEAMMAAELCMAQSLDNMRAGIYVIPEKTLNTYFAAMAGNVPKVKETAVHILDNDKIIILVDVEDVGRLRFACTIKEFYYDANRASLKLHADKKEVVGRSVKSWFLNQMSLRFITKIYGNPLKEMNVNNKVKGNNIEIDLQPFADRLFKDGIGRSIGDALVISKVSTTAGVINFHTNCAITIL